MCSPEDSDGRMTEQQSWPIKNAPFQMKCFSKTECFLCSEYLSSNTGCKQKARVRHSPRQAQRRGRPPENAVRGPGRQERKARVRHSPRWARRRGRPPENTGRLPGGPRRGPGGQERKAGRGGGSDGSGEAAAPGQVASGKAGGYLILASTAHHPPPGRRWGSNRRLI